MSRLSISRLLSTPSSRSDLLPRRFPPTSRQFNPKFAGETRVQDDASLMGDLDSHPPESVPSSSMVFFWTLPLRGRFTPGETCPRGVNLPLLLRPHRTRALPGRFAFRRILHPSSIPLQDPTRRFRTSPSFATVRPRTLSRWSTPPNVIPHSQDSRGPPVSPPRHHLPTFVELPSFGL